jgi:L-alanine-DL-glutamate epimerase-like enolase superfamily enzyme
MKTKLCLDESICRIDQLENMIKYKWIDILNIKIWRVWWVYSAYKINKICEKNNIWTWVWWLLETSVWKSFNLAIAWMKNCKYSNDFSVWNEFYSDYIIKEPNIIENWEIKIDLNVKWVWFEVDLEKIEKYCEDKFIFK